MDRDLLYWVQDKLTQLAETLEGHPAALTIAVLREQIGVRINELVSMRVRRALEVLTTECPTMADKLIVAQSYNVTIAEQRDKFRKELETLQRKTGTRTGV